MRDTDGRILRQIGGDLKCKGPFHRSDLKHENSSGYPLYEAVVVNGVTEIIEHKKMEPIFYITDDPGVLEQYRLHGCA
jgi:hypothetical protein